MDSALVVRSSAISLWYSCSSVDIAATYICWCNVVTFAQEQTFHGCEGEGVTVFAEPRGRTSVAS